MPDWHPIVLIQDRYGGCYSGGPWLALVQASEQVDSVNNRAQFCLKGFDGPYGGDVEAAQFWSDPPSWIAVGSTPDEALSALSQKLRASG